MTPTSFSNTVNGMNKTSSGKLTNGFASDEEEEKNNSCEQFACLQYLNNYSDFITEYPNELSRQMSQFHCLHIQAAQAMSKLEDLGEQMLRLEAVGSEQESNYDEKQESNDKFNYEQKKLAIMRDIERYLLLLEDITHRKIEVSEVLLESIKHKEKELDSDYNLAVLGNALQTITCGTRSGKLWSKREDDLSNLQPIVNANSMSKSKSAKSVPQRRNSSANEEMSSNRKPLEVKMPAEVRHKNNDLKKPSKLAPTKQHTISSRLIEKKKKKNRDFKKLELTFGLHFKKCQIRKHNKNYKTTSQKLIIQMPSKSPSEKNDSAYFSDELNEKDLREIGTQPAKEITKEAQNNKFVISNSSKKPLANKSNIAKKKAFNSNDDFSNKIYICDPNDPDEPVYCLCQRISFGDMICCDNSDCQIEWFHFDCVKLSHKPKGRWYCPLCKKRDKD